MLKLVQLPVIQIISNIGHFMGAWLRPWNLWTLTRSPFSGRISRIPRSMSSELLWRALSGGAYKTAPWHHGSFFQIAHFWSNEEGSTQGGSLFPDGAKLGNVMKLTGFQSPNGQPSQGPRSWPLSKVNALIIIPYNDTWAARGLVNLAQAAWIRVYIYIYMYIPVYIYIMLYVICLFSISFKWIHLAIVIPLDSNLFKIGRKITSQIILIIIVCNLMLMSIFAQLLRGFTYFSFLIIFHSTLDHDHRKDQM